MIKPMVSLCWRLIIRFKTKIVFHSMESKHIELRTKDTWLKQTEKDQVTKRAIELWKKHLFHANIINLLLLRRVGSSLLTETNNCKRIHYPTLISALYKRQVLQLNIFIVMLRKELYLYKLATQVETANNYFCNKIKHGSEKLPAVTKRRLCWRRLWARPLGFFFLSCFATFGVCPLTLPARAKDPWTFPEISKHSHRSIDLTFTNMQ